MSVLFRSGSVKSRLIGILKSTQAHARALGSFVFIYKSVLYLLKYLRKATGKSSNTMLKDITSHSNALDTFWAGLIGGYLVFGRNTATAGLSTINQQMVLYVFSRVVIGLAKLFTKKVLVPQSTTKAITDSKLAATTWAVMSSVSWALVMFMFRYDSTVLQKSMLHSMNYLYIDSESWNGLDDFI